MISSEIRKRFLNFFRKNRHKVLPGSSLIPDNDPSLLFVNAGMNQFKNVFLGLERPPAKNVVTIQKCLRAGGKHNDLENVGDTPSHHTFFEMMGNFSFGGYFKNPAIALAWEFLTKELNLNPEDLWISVYEKDKESYEIWRDEQKIPENKIYQLGEKSNFWQMGEAGPCGPCAEIHYYRGKETRPDPSQFIEIWNLVFMEFYDTEEGKRQKLPIPCVDTGMGLERLCSVLQNKKSNYHTDLFSEIISSLEKASSCKYDLEEKNQTDQQKAFRVLADHSRAVCFLINDGVSPGNDKESYVLRRIIRRALYYSQKLHPTKNLLQVGVEKTITLMDEIGSLLKKDQELTPVTETYLSLKGEEKRIQSIIGRETKQFFDSLKEGRKQLEVIMESLPKKFIPVKEVWNLYSTYGFPIDLTCLIAKEKGWTVAKEEEIEKYKKEVSKQLTSVISKNQWEDFKKKNDSLKMIIDSLEPSQTKTTWTGYEQDKEEGKIVAVLSVLPEKPSDSGPTFIIVPGQVQISNSCIPKGLKGYVILDKTCFYPEGGGPIGDRGWLLKIEHQTKRKKIIASVLDCQKKGDFIIHEVEAQEDITPGQSCYMEVNKNFRKDVKSSHTATHLLNSALRTVLGESVRQSGSLVEPGRLRFDFTHSKALTEKECRQVEEWIWQSLEREENLSSSFKKLEQAKEEGALFLKGENYDSEVRVINIGEKTSKELCGGIHVQNTREIESFKIVSERGIQSGVRRIVAYAGFLAKSWEAFLVQQNLKLREYLKLPLPEERPGDSLFIEKEKFFWKGTLEKENPFLIWIENKEKELKIFRKTIVRLEGKDSLETVLSNNQEFIKIKSRFHPLAQQVLELREHLKLSLPKAEKVMDFFLKQNTPNKTVSFKESFEKPDNSTHSSKTKEKGNRTTDNQKETKKSSGWTKEQLIEKARDCFEESENPLNWMKAKNQEAYKLKEQLKKIKSLGRTKEQLLEKAKDFKLGGLKGKLLVADLPLEDRKMISDISDFLLSKLSSGLVILSGEGEGKHPVLVNRTKDFEGLLSAGDILKNTVAPLCKGKGGGKASFAQGSITDKSKFSDLETFLLEKWSKLL